MAGGCPFTGEPPAGEVKKKHPAPLLDNSNT